MQSPDGLRQENEAPRDRVSRLNSAILRISSSLDLSVVLREVVDGTRALAEDWGLPLSLLPENWQELAARTGSLRRPRKYPRRHPRPAVLQGEHLGLRRGGLEPAPELPTHWRTEVVPVFRTTR